MKLIIPALTIALGLATVGAETPVSNLMTLSAIHALSNEDARKGQKVEFEGTVVYSRGYENLLFVQDGQNAIFVRPPQTDGFTPGDRVLVHGRMLASFRPLVIGEAISLLGHGTVPTAMPATFDELIRAQLDCRLVTVHAVVRAIDPVVSPIAPVRSARLQLVTEGGHFEANLDAGNSQGLSDLLDAEVEITGAAAGKFDDKMQQTGVVLYVSSIRDIRVIKKASKSPWLLPVTPMDQVLGVYHANDLTPRVRVQGTITYYQPGSAIVLQDGSKSLWIETHSRERLPIGDLADVTGFPDAHDRRLILTDGEIHDRAVFQPIKPQATTWHQLGYWSSDSPEGHMYDLVSVEGKVEAKVREASEDEYVLNADGRLFTAIYRHPQGSSELPSMAHIELGSKVRVTGICVMVQANSINPGEEVPFNILLRSYDDIAVIANPTLLSVRNLLVVVGFLLLIVAAGGVRTLIVDGRVRRESVRSAYIERRRSKILEDVNGTRSLVEIMEEITELVSFRLHGSPCWCQIKDGAQIGNTPSKLSSFRVFEELIPARSGQPLGRLCAAFDALAKPVETESEILSNGAALAALAIENRRLYSDLRHRSEFDQLTEIHNRFSLEKHLDALIDQAQVVPSKFALIYIDLDRFKLVNDQYGHRVGDLYLRAVAHRMKRQLRGEDLIARLGGDEFAVLVPQVQSSADAMEIVKRLESCFVEPFVFDDCTLRGSASLGIAVFPEDGTSKDALLTSSDAGMYVSKHSRKRHAGISVGR